jgi:hypothetical protein
MSVPSQSFQVMECAHSDRWQRRRWWGRGRYIRRRHGSRQNRANFSVFTWLVPFQVDSQRTAGDACLRHGRLVRACAPLRGLQRRCMCMRVCMRVCVCICVCVCVVSCLFFFAGSYASRLFLIVVVVVCSMQYVLIRCVVRATLCLHYYLHRFVEQ